MERLQDKAILIRFMDVNTQYSQMLLLPGASIPELERFLGGKISLDEEREATYVSLKKEHYSEDMHSALIGLCASSMTHYGFESDEGDVERKVKELEQFLYNADCGIQATVRTIDQKSAKEYKEYITAANLLQPNGSRRPAASCGAIS